MKYNMSSQYMAMMDRSVFISQVNWEVFCISCLRLCQPALIAPLPAEAGIAPAQPHNKERFKLLNFKP